MSKAEFSPKPGKTRSGLRKSHYAIEEVVTVFWLKEFAVAGKNKVRS